MNAPIHLLAYDVECLFAQRSIVGQLILAVLAHFLRLCSFHNLRNTPAQGWMYVMAAHQSRLTPRRCQTDSFSPDHSRCISAEVASRSSSAPCASMRPSRSTMMWSARRRTGRRCETTSNVANAFHLT